MHKQTDGLAMGAPTAAIIAETYIQYMEHAQTNRWTSNGSPNISNYSRNIYTVYGICTNRWTSYENPNIGKNSRNLYTVYGTYTNKQMD
jgi:hypothetical protein